MNSITAFFVVASLHTAIAQQTPSISFISQKQIKDIGGAVELRCTVQHQQDYPVVWMKMNGADQVPISSRDSLILHDGRFLLHYEEKSGTGTYKLRIKDIQETDAGNYQCQVHINMNKKISELVELVLRTAPIISKNSTQSVVAREGSDLNLECHAEGYPMPNISWRRENDDILPMGGAVYRGNALKIERVRKEDRGIYVCIAENQVGPGARKKIKAQVEFPPVITSHSPRVGQAIQYCTDMVCHVEAYPLPTITWYRNGAQLANSWDYTISNFPNGDLIDSYLRVCRIAKEKYGGYICKAENALGSDEMTFELYETETPTVANKLPTDK